MKFLIFLFYFRFNSEFLCIFFIFFLIMEWLIAFLPLFPLFAVNLVNKLL